MTTVPVPPPTDAEVEALVSRGTELFRRAERTALMFGGASELLQAVEQVPSLLLALRALQVQRTAERERLARARELANRIADSDRWQHLNEHVGWYCSECGAGAKPSYDMLAITHRPDCIVTLARSVLADTSAAGEGSEGTT